MIPQNELIRRAAKDLGDPGTGEVFEGAAATFLLQSNVARTMVGGTMSFEDYSRLIAFERGRTVALVSARAEPLLLDEGVKFIAPKTLVFEGHRMLAVALEEEPTYKDPTWQSLVAQILCAFSDESSAHFEKHDET